MAEARTDLGTLQYVEQLPPAEFSRDEIAILRKVNQEIAGAPDLKRTMDYLFRATKEISRCDRVSIAFADESSHRLVSYHVVADYEPILLPAGYSEDLAGSSLEKIIRVGRCRLIGDLVEYAQNHPDSRSTQLLLAEGVRSSMTCPLKVEGRTIGVLFRSSKQPNSFTMHQVRIHLAITERLSQAIEKAYRIEQLARANQAYMEVLGFVTHELKSPVASMVMTAELLADETFGPVTDKQKESLSRIRAKGEYLLTLVRDYLNLARLESGELEIHARPNVDFVGEVVQPAVDVVEPYLLDRSMTLDQELDVSADVECDPDLMRIVMTNLLSNAVKYGRQGGRILLHVHNGDHRLDVSVWNEGPGFPPEQRDRLFRKFSRLDDPALKKVKGTGVGLYTVWRILNQHGGRIEADSLQGQYAEFTFHLPKPLPRESAAL